MSDASASFITAQAIPNKQSKESSRSEKVTRPKNRCELSGSDGTSVQIDCPCSRSGVFVQSCGVFGRRRPQLDTDANARKRGDRNVN